MRWVQGPAVRALDDPSGSGTVSRGITSFQYLIVGIDGVYKPPFTTHPAVIALGVQMKLEIPD